MNYWLAILIALGTTEVFAETLEIPESVQEAVFSYMIGKDPLFVPCLLVYGEDPPASIVEKLSRSDIPVVPGSECEEASDLKRGSYHRPTGHGAMFYRLTVYRVVDETNVAVYYESYHDGLWGEGVTLDLVLQDNQWVVTKRKLSYIQ